MKYFLIIWVCSFGTNMQCGPAMQKPTAYNSWSECSKGAHIESWNMLNEIDVKLIDKYNIGTRYICKADIPI